MKSLVIYYSFEGNTKFIAEHIANTINADIAELKPIKDINASGMMKIAWGVRQLVSESEPKLLPLDINLDDYDLIFIGTPVWTFTFAPPVRTFLKQFPEINKKVAIYCCHEGDKGNTLINMRKQLNGNFVIGENDFFEPLSNEKEQNRDNAIEWTLEMVEKTR